ncbi:MAG: NADH-dependent [FeFe] hydrogenase, group A6 [Elusimicrobiota bacterium]
MVDKQVRIKINGTDYLMYEGISLLEACFKAGIKIPSLCYLEGLSQRASCGICVVEVKGAKSLVRACVTQIREGIEVFTNTARVRRARKTNLKLLLSNHPRNCLQCDKNLKCELQKMAEELDVKDTTYPNIRKKHIPLDETSHSLVRDHDKCILCARCVEVCNQVQTVDAIEIAGRGMDAHVSTFFDEGLGNSECVNCGQCLLVCPTGALMARNETDKVWDDIDNPNKFVVVQTAPAIRAAIGEEFGLAPGAALTAKLVAALRKMNFNRVFDTQFSADLTIVEEASELIERITNKKPLPMITSCSPGWIKFAENFFPEIIEHVSSCKSPQQMFGALAKTFYAKKLDMDPRNISVVSVMPCTAKKFEARRKEMVSAYNFWKEELELKDEDVFPDVDHVLTTRELADMLREAGIDFVNIAGERFDRPLGVSTGAGTIFGTTGGVMEAALRTAYFKLSGQKLSSLNLEEVRGMKGVKEAEVKINGKKVKVAVAHGLGNARKVLEPVKKGNSPYQFIEIMTCPGGCIGGGGQPIPTNYEIRKKRALALYQEDEAMEFRQSHENPALIELYESFLEKPLGKLSHSLLHTAYRAKKPSGK